jgi:SET domain-containing protein
MLHRHIVLKNMGEKGLGLVAIERIRKNTLIWFEDAIPIKYSLKEIATIDPEIAKQCAWNGSEFIFVPDDPANRMNHSCNPNCWYIGDSLYSRIDIEKGEEVNYDYAMEETANSPVNRFEQCLCGTEECRGVVRYNDLVLYPYLRKRYEGHLPPHTVKWLEEELAKLEINF